MNEETMLAATLAIAIVALAAVAGLVLVARALTRELAAARESILAKSLAELREGRTAPAPPPPEVEESASERRLREIEERGLEAIAEGFVHGGGGF